MHQGQIHLLPGLCLLNRVHISHLTSSQIQVTLEHEFILLGFCDKSLSASDVHRGIYYLYTTLSILSKVIHIIYCELHEIDE